MATSNSSILFERFTPADSTNSPFSSPDVYPISRANFSAQYLSIAQRGASLEMEAAMERAGEWVEFEDGELVVAALLGNLAAFDELVRRFRPAARMTARRYVENEDAAEDLCQEAFLRAFKALPYLEEMDRFGAWLHAIVRNLALRQRQYDARDRDRCSPLDQLLLEECASLEPSPVEIIARIETHAAVREGVSALPEPYRAVVQMHYWEGMSLRIVAEDLGLPLTTVKWRLRRAQALLRRNLGPPAAVLC
jgi:RNA polymerase sigma-70 factor (ECF subfamily)